MPSKTIIFLLWVLAFAATPTVASNRHCPTETDPAREYIAESDSNLSQTATTCMTKGLTNAIRGNYSMASQALHQAAKLFEKAGKPRQEAGALHGRAKAVFHLGKKRLALELLRRARTLYRKTEQEAQRGDTWFEEGEMLSIVNDAPAALAAYRKARAIHQTVGLPLDEATAWLREAETLLGLGKREEALVAALKAKTLYEQYGTIAQQGSAWLEEAKIRLAMDNPLGARSALQQAQTLAPPSEPARERLGKLAELMRRAAMTSQELENLREDYPEAWAAQEEAHPNIYSEEERIDLLAQAQILFTYVGQISEAAQVGETTARLYAQLDKEESAITHLEEAVRKYELTNDLTEAALALKQVATMHAHLGRPSVAVSFLSRAASLANQADAPETAGELPAHRANLQVGLGDYEEAIATMQGAKAHFDAVNDDRASMALALQGFIRGLRGDREPPEWIQASTLQEERSRFEATWLVGRAYHSIMLGKLQTAIRHLNSAKRITSEAVKGPSFLKFVILMARGRLFLAIPRLQTAISDFKEARQVALNAEARDNAAQAWSAECEAMEITEATSEAEACWHNYQAEGFQPLPDDHDSIGALPFDLNIPEAGLDPWSIPEKTKERAEDLNALVLTNFFSLTRVIELIDRGRIEEAQRVFNSIERSALGESDLLLALWHLAAGLTQITALDQLETSQLAEHKAIVALDHFRSARRLLGASVRNGLVTRDQKAELLSGLPSLVQTVVYPLWLKGAYEEVLAEAEAGRARTLLDALHGNDETNERGRGDLADLQKQRTEVEAELADLEEEIRQAGRAEKEILSERRQALDRKLDLLRFEELLAQGSDSPGADPSSLDTIWQTVDQVGPVVYYYWLGDVPEGAAIGFLLVPGERKIHSTMVLPPGEHQNPVEFIEEANLSLANPIMDIGGVQAYRSVLPFPDKLPPDGPLVIIPHGPLHQFPFAALLDDQGVPLGRRYQLTLAPSLSVLGNVLKRDRLGEREAPNPTEEQALLIASGRGLGLPLHEVREVSNLFDPKQTTILDTQQATVEAYRSHAPKARQMLIASKAVVFADSQRRSFIELSRADDHDARLTAADVASVPIDADLVTLAACDTAHSTPMLNDEHLDLSRAFLLAGSSAILATRWKVPETYETSLFLEDFYRIYLTGGPDSDGLRKDEALRQARTLSMERGAPPQFWAAWVLIGDGR